MDDEVRLRSGTPEDIAAVCELLGLVFHQEFEGEVKAAETAVYEPGRSLIAETTGCWPGTPWRSAAS